MNTATDRTVAPVSMVRVLEQRLRCKFQQFQAAENIQLIQWIISTTNFAINLIFHLNKSHSYKWFVEILWKLKPLFFCSFFKHIFWKGTYGKLFYYTPPFWLTIAAGRQHKLRKLEAEGKGTKASEGKCGNVKRGVVVTGLFLWSIYSKTCSDILHKAVSYRY